MTPAEFPIKDVIIQTVVKVDSYDLDRFISEHYGIPFESVPDQLLHNGSDLVTIVKKREMDTYEISQLEKWKSGEYVGSMLDTLLTDLCNRNILPGCELLVYVLW